VRTSAAFAVIGVGAAEVPMLIEIKDLEINPIDFREEYGPV